MYTDETGPPGARDVTVAPVESHAEEPQVHIGPSSVWPIAMAFAIATIGLGICSMWQISIGGLVLFVLSIIFWVQELRHEYL